MIDEVVLLSEPRQGTILVGEHLNRAARFVVPHEQVGGLLVAEIAHHDGVRRDEAVGQRR